MNERLYILSIDGNRKKLYKTCMRSGFRSVYILLLACTTSTKQQPHENYFWILSITLVFSTTAMMPSGRIRKIRSHPNLKRKFSWNIWLSRYFPYNLEYLNNFVIYEFYICLLRINLSIPGFLLFYSLILSSLFIRWMQ